MPELPEVETTRRGIAPHIEGLRVARVCVRQPRLRWPVPPELPGLLTGKRLLSVSRRGKYLLLDFGHGHLLMHLGMSGSLRITTNNQPPQTHDHADLVFTGGVTLRFTDPRRFGALIWSEDPPAQHPLLASLGPEPLADDFDGDYLFSRGRKRKLSIKSFLMDSKVVVGVGNIYANEALHAAGIRPTRPAGRLSRDSCSCLVTEVKQVLERAIEQGGTTLRDFVGGDGKPGYFKQELLVYGRGGLPCLGCDRPLKEVRLGQRSTVYCTHCQR